MPLHQWTVLCDRYELTNERNLNLQEVIEEVHVMVPAAHRGSPFNIGVNWTLATLWRREDPDKSESFTMRLRLRDPRGTYRAPIEQAVQLQTLRARCLAAIEGITIRESGPHVFVVDYRPDGQREWISAAELVLDVDVEFDATLPPA